MDIVLKVAIIVLCVIIIISVILMYNISEQLFEINLMFNDIREMIEQIVLTKVEFFIN